MIDPATLQLLMAGLYLVFVVGMALYLRSYDGVARQVGKLTIAVVLVSAVGAALQGLGIGEYGDGLSAAGFVDDIVAYSLLFGLTAWFAGTSRQLVALVPGLSVLSRVVIEAGSILESTLPAVLLLALLVTVLTFFARVYLLWGPVWRAAQDCHPDRTLLFWKARNLLMLLMGMNILVVLLIGAGLVDQFTQLLMLEYVNFLLRAGFAAFLLSNVNALAKSDATLAFDTAAESGTTPSGGAD